MGFHEKVRATIGREHLLQPGETVLLGVSGGPDSMALLCSLHALGYTCIVVHCNFNLRGDESVRDEQFVKNFCAEHGFKLYIKSFDTKQNASENKVSVEMAARDLRYACFQKIKEQYQLRSIAVAHHRDDNVETLLLNLVRGTGIRGLCGMKYRNGKDIIRPLLDVSRQEIMNYLKERQIPFVTDHTNLESAEIKRNYVRLEILPMLRRLNPSVDECIQRSTRYFNEVEKVYLQSLKNDMRHLLFRTSYGQTGMSISELTKCTSPSALLFEWLSPYKFNAGQVEDILRSLCKGGEMFPSPLGYRLYIDRDSLILDAPPEYFSPVTMEGEGTFALNCGRMLKVEFCRWGTDSEVLKSGDYAFLDAEKVAFPLVIRTPRKGDRFQPYGMKGSQLISDYLTNKKVPLYERPYKLVVESGDSILWLVGHRTAQKAAIGAHTRYAVVLSLETD